MRPLALLAAFATLVPATLAAQAPRGPATIRALPVASVADTTTVIRFDIPALPLGEALDRFARQSGIRVEVEAAALVSVQSQPIAGSYRAPEALRLLLGATALQVRFTDQEAVVVSREAADGLTVYRLESFTVLGDRNRGYRTTRTSSATRTDTPLRDVPQALSIVTRQLIADQSMQGMADVVRYVPGIAMGTGEGHTDQPVIRGTRTNADFYVDGMRDDAEYLRDTYNVERVEALKGPNAMIFGRGGGGGVINRVEKEAQWVWTRSLTAEAGTYDHRRGMLDVGGPVASALAARFNGLYEEGKGFRDFADRKRWGVNPNAAATLGDRATLRAGFEFYRDGRSVDRGIPSFEGRPSDAPIETFFGNPGVSTSISRVHSANASADLTLPAGFTVRSKLRWADYDKFYQNSYAGGAVNAAGTSVSLSAYNNSINRDNLISQTDVLRSFVTGPARHTLLAGADVTRSATRGFRNTGYYNNASTSLAVPFNSPTVTTPITFRQSATDADYYSTNSATGVYAQDQIALGRHWQAILGIRRDWFGIDFDDHRTRAHLERDDALTSPRAGLVFKPIEAASLYGSYSVSHLPSSGDQASRLTVTTETLEPEKFTSGELGAKWDVRPDLALTAAVFRLDRTNTTAPDPNDPTRTVQTGSQRSEGFEVGLTGNVTAAWQIAGGFTGQRAEITSRTTAAPVGAKAQLVPHKQASLWNRVQLTSLLGAGAGVIYQTDMFAAIDNTVTLPGFTRVDAAIFVTPVAAFTAQLNVENLLDRKYYASSNGNNNIMPGAPRTIRISITAHP